MSRPRRRIADSRAFRIADDDVGLHGSAQLHEPNFPSEVTIKSACRPVVGRDSGSIDHMHQAARLEFERVMEEFVRWHVVPEDERSPAPAWWWGPAMAVVDDQAPMSAACCCALDVSEGTSFADGARAILALFNEQTSLTAPQDFPSKAEGEEHEVRELHPQPSDDSAFQP